MSCTYAPAAIADLDAIQDGVYAASRDEETTVRYMEELIQRIEEKDLFPASGSPLYLNSWFTGYYFVVYKAYVAFYYLTEDGICVERILPKKCDALHWLGLKD